MRLKLVYEYYDCHYPIESEYLSDEYFFKDVPALYFTYDSSEQLYILEQDNYSLSDNNDYDNYNEDCISDEFELLTTDRRNGSNVSIIFE